MSFINDPDLAVLAKAEPVARHPTGANPALQLSIRQWTLKPAFSHFLQRGVPNHVIHFGIRRSGGHKRDPPSYCAAHQVKRLQLNSVRSKVNRPLTRLRQLAHQRGSTSQVLIQVSIKATSILHHLPQQQQPLASQIPEPLFIVLLGLCQALVTLQKAHPQLMHAARPQIQCPRFDSTNVIPSTLRVERVRQPGRILMPLSGGPVDSEVCMPLLICRRLIP
eukprot:6492074-Amphidinium_carterae.1